jgi:hypothetical protein
MKCLFDDWIMEACWELHQAVSGKLRIFSETEIMQK